MNFKVTYKNVPYDISADYNEGRQSELVLFLHGLGCNKESFKDVLDDKRFDTFSLLIPDLIGFGASSKPDDFSYTMEDQAAILLLLLKQFKVKKIHLVIHSMGGAIGILLAEKLDERLGKIINVEGNLVAEDCGVASRKSAVVSFEEFKNSVFPQMIEYFASSKNPGEQYWPQQAEQASKIAFHKSAKSLVEWSDSGELLGKFLHLATEKYYLYGDKSDQWAASGGRLAKAFKGKIYTISISNTTHFITNDHPKEFGTQLVNLLINKN
jgi:pimeloyl-ACP methyl ester carboxylesterase